MVEVLTRSLADTDPEVHSRSRGAEAAAGTLEMIASENFAPAAVMEARARC